MNPKLNGTCSDPDFFRALSPTQPAAQCRTLVLAAYSEKELAADKAASVGSHLEKCPACTQFLADLDGADGVDVACAVCPSSGLLDRYLFNRPSVTAEESAQIEKHFRECPLCREECEWLKNLEAPAVIPLERTPRAWLQPLLAAAAVAVIAAASFLFWRGNVPNPNADKLMALAVIKEPAQIDFAGLESSSTALDPEAGALYAQAVAEFKSGQYQEAGGKLEEVLRRAPGHSGAVFLLGYSYYKIGEPQKAFDLCARAESIRPHSYERCMFLVNIALKTGNFRRAFTEISALYHEAPEDPGIRDMYQKITALMPDRKKI